jgi:ATP-dependent DNA helicase RecG
LGIRAFGETHLADLYHRIGFIEKAGTGIERMREGARESGCPEPVLMPTDFSP